MIKRSFTVAVLAAGLSGLAHVGGLSALWSRDEVQIEGGAEATVARLGDSFRDVAVGELTPDEVDEPLKKVQPETVEKPVEPDQRVEEAEVTETPPPETPPLAEKRPVDPIELVQKIKPEPLAQAKLTPTPAKPVQQTSPAQPTETDRQPAPQATPDRTAAMAVPRAATAPTLSAITPTPQVTALRPEAVTPTPVEPDREPSEPAAPQTLTALPNENEAAPLLSNRPTLRPRAIEEAAAKRATQPKPRANAQAKPKANQPPRGNGQTAERRGSAQGQAQAKSNTAASDPGRKQQAAGNAAASNYPGVVLRKIQRRKPRTSIRGTAVVSFAIAPSGALAALSLSQSSGSPKLDQLALSAVRRAAPFPRPPAGARTRFRLPVKGR